ncbi:hypothetical protein HAX54_011469 [Datura stramonium]|uniref:Secreted protein n=1 Tax=Datura stramonium TaxID=4076 RepID=A0ABS8Y3F9_DATST|nr:hypothetical protein [Datura stramonium]
MVFSCMMFICLKLCVLTALSVTPTTSSLLSLDFVNFMCILGTELVILGATVEECGAVQFIILALQAEYKFQPSE